ncbi:MAG: hypothetical protein K8T20_08715 [Planctomycetes bacterium]|nr:hypothetical protein [Planctomycetota bacterium]
MKALIAAVSAIALMSGIGSSEAHAENFFKKINRAVRNAHERHVDMMESAHERHVEILRDVARDSRRGHYETVEVQEWVAGYEKVEFVEVREAGHFEFRQVTEIVTPARCEKIYIQPVYRIERDRCGAEIRIMVKCGYWTTREIPAVTCTKTIKVWVEGECKRVPRTVCVPGHYETQCKRVWVCD